MLDSASGEVTSIRAVLREFCKVDFISKASNKGTAHGLNKDAVWPPTCKVDWARVYNQDTMASISANALKAQQRGMLAMCIAGGRNVLIVALFKEVRRGNTSTMLRSLVTRRFRGRTVRPCHS